MKILLLHPTFFAMLLICLLAQRGITQHCTPSFHFTVEGYTTQFEDLSTADGDITSWLWDFGDSQTSNEQNPSHTYADAGTYNVCLTIEAHNPGCTATFCHHVVIHGPPPGSCHAAFSAHQPDPEQQIVDFTDVSTSDGVIGTWEWDFGDGNISTEQNPTHSYTGPGTYNVCLTITDDDGGCTNHVCHSIVVHHPPAGICHAAFNFHQPDPEVYIIDFTDESTSDGVIGTWEWVFGDGNSSNEQNPTHSYESPGTYTVCLTITDDDGGCTNHVCHEITVHHAPDGVCHAGFVAHQPELDLQTVIFTDQSTSDGVIVSWLWDFGDGSTSTEQNPTHTYSAYGTYLVCLNITDDNGCASHACHHITIHHPPAEICQPLFFAHQPDQNDFTINFTDHSSSSDTIVTWAWDFGDGNISNEQNPSHTYSLPGTYQVCLTITDNDGSCHNHYCHHVVIHPITLLLDNVVQFKVPTANFNFNADLPITKRTVQAEEENRLSVYPNPFSSAATIEYESFEDSASNIDLLDMFGQRVMHLWDGTESKGRRSIYFERDQLPAGFYIIRITLGQEILIKRIVIVD